MIIIMSQRCILGIETAILLKQKYIGNKSKHNADVSLLVLWKSAEFCQAYLWDGVDANSGYGTSGSFL